MILGGFMSMHAQCHSLARRDRVDQEYHYTYYIIYSHSNEKKDPYIHTHSRSVTKVRMHSEHSQEINPPRYDRH